MPQVRHIELVSKWGKITWGKRPEGFEGWSFQEPGGGGTVTIPWARLPGGEILVGMIPELRSNMGETLRWCAIGGILEPEESHRAGGIREAGEESGLDTSTAKLLPGSPIVNERLYFVADPTKGEGNHFYQMPISGDNLEPAEYGTWKATPGVLKAKGESDLRFFPWKTAARMTSDSLMTAAILRLLIEIGDNN